MPNNDIQIIIRDLWSLRLQMLKDITDGPTEDGGIQQLFSTQSETENSDTDAIEGRESKTRHLENAPRMIDTVALCYLAILLLRLPISLGNVYGWIMEEGFIYLRAINAIPRVMRQKLPLTLRRAFHVRTGAPDLGRLYKTTLNLAAAFQEAFGMEMPKLNYPLLLFRYISDLTLPLDVFPSVQRMSHLIKYDFGFPTSTQKYNHLADHPESQLILLLVISIKLLYPFDEVERHPTKATEPSTLTVNWNVWNKVHAHPIIRSQSQSRRSIQNFFEKTENDVFDMSHQETDEYLDWFQRTWLDAEPNERGTDIDFRKALCDMFPIKAIETPTANEPESEQLAVLREKLQRVKVIQSSLILHQPFEEREDLEEERLRPGSRYRHYRSSQDIPQNARLFFETVAKLVGLSIDMLVTMVFETELKLQSWVRQQRKKEKGMDDGHDSVSPEISD